MKYSLHKDNVICLIPGRKDLRVRVARGKIWITKKAEDRILAAGDAITLRNCGKVSVQAFDDSHILLYGTRFSLHEVLRENEGMRINRVKIGQTDKPLTPSG